MTPCPWCGSDNATGKCPKSIPCPDCHQPPGADCKRPSGHRASRIHANRIAAAGLTENGPTRTGPPVHSEQLDLGQT